MRDLRYAVRALRRTPGFTIVAVLSLALGIGANAAIFSVIDALMWKALPIREADRLVLLTTSGTYNLSYGLYEKLRDGTAGAMDLAASIRSDRFNASVDAPGGAAIDPGPVRLSLVSGNYFPAMAVGAAIGSPLAPGHDRAGAPPVAVISDGYWTSRFGRAPDIAGRTLTLSGVTFEVIGVTPAGFTGEWVGRPADVWVPIVWQPQIMTEIPVGGLRNAGALVIGRLHPAVSRGQAQSALEIAFAQARRDELGPAPTPQQVQELARDRIEVETGARGFSPQRQSFGQSLSILLMAVGLLLLIACANIANLMLARASARQREIAVRLALGAGRGRLIRQMLAESMVIATLAGAVGLLFARWAAMVIAAFVRADPAGRAAGLSMDLDLATDGRWLAFTAALSLLTAIAFGLWPALRASSVSLAPSLAARGANSGSRGHFRPGKLLVVSQVALSLILLIGAGLFVRTLDNLTSQDLGFARDHVLLIWTLPGQSGGRGSAAAPFWQTLDERLAAVPGVVSVSASNQGVLNGAEAGGGSGPALRVEGGTRATAGLAGWRSFVSPGFFQTMGIALVAGRDFTERDTAAAPRAVIVNQTFAAHYFGDRNPVGLHVWFPEDAGAPTEIVGLVKDFTGGTPREAVRRPALSYFSYRDKEAARRLRTMTIAVRTSDAPAAIAPRLRQALRELDPTLPVLKIDTVDEQLRDVLIQERLMAALSGFFGLIALLLACLGLYGVISYSVGRRTSELGIRLALGATRRELLAMVLRESLALVAAGVAIGVPVTLAATRLIAARLFGISPTDPLTIVSAALVMLAVATAAALVPANRASRVDPMQALRDD